MAPSRGTKSQRDVGADVHRRRLGRGGCATRASASVSRKPRAAVESTVAPYQPAGPAAARTPHSACRETPEYVPPNGAARRGPAPRPSPTTCRSLSARLLHHAEIDGIADHDRGTHRPRARSRRRLRPSSGSRRIRRLHDDQRRRLCRPPRARSSRSSTPSGEGASRIRRPGVHVTSSNTGR